MISTALPAGPSFCASSRVFRGAVAVLALICLAACSGKPRDTGAEAEARQIALLTAEIQALGPNVDPDEAARAARLAFSHTRQLAIEYQIEDSPLVHNSKVNLGIKPRGLCWHWAEDMEKRLARERFRTLDLHRAIANHDKQLLIEHSTTIVSAKGSAWDDGVVLDPWRWGGKLFWAKVVEDKRYDWWERSDVFAWKRARNEAEARREAWKYE